MINMWGAKYVTWTCCLRFNVSYSKVLNKNKEKKYERVLEINTNSMEI